MRAKKGMLWLIFSGCIFCQMVLKIDVAMAASQVSVNFVDIKTRDLLKILAEHSNKSVIISEKIDGKITVDLRDLSWREALDAILQMQGLIKHETDHVITILATSEVSKSEQSILHPTLFNLHHISADKVDKLLKPAGVLSSYGKSGADEGSNSLVVADTDDKISVIKSLIKQIDTPAKQVLIEARIVSADENFMHELGVGIINEQQSGDRAKYRRSSLAVNADGGQFNFSIAKLMNNTVLDLELSALETEGRGKVISKPKLLTAERQAAYIEAGAEIPYQEKSKEGNTSTTFKKAVLSLKVTPEVVASDLVSLTLQLNQDKVGQMLVNGVPTIDTRKIHTQVLVHDNETVVLGGIYEWSKRTTIANVPFLGKIPLLEILFRKKEIKIERKELLIFVTPRIIKSKP